MPPQSSQRIQVGFSEPVLQVVKKLAEEEDMKMAKVCSILIEEALILRNRLPANRISQMLPHPSLVGGFFPPTTDEEKTKVIKTTGQEPFTVKPKTNTLSQELAETASETATEALTSQTTTSLQEQKLKLMTELMEQLKTL